MGPGVSRDGFTSVEFFIFGGFMFLLGILATLAGRAVIRTQVKSYKDQDSTKIQIFLRQKTEVNVFFMFQCLPPKNVEEQQQAEEIQDGGDSLNHTVV